MHVSEGELRWPITLIHQGKVTGKEEVIEKTVPRSSVGMSEDVLIALPTLQKTMNPFCSLRDIDFLSSSRRKSLSTVRDFQVS